MKLATAPKAYDAGDQARMRGEIERADAQNLKRGVASDRVLLTSPNNTVWALTVSDTGVISAAALP